MVNDVYKTFLTYILSKYKDSQEKNILFNKINKTKNGFLTAIEKSIHFYFNINLYWNRNENLINW